MKCINDIFSFFSKNSISIDIQYVTELSNVYNSITGKIRK